MNQRFVFLINDGSTTLLAPGYGVNAVEAKRSLVSGLNAAWHVVEDKKTIARFIQENKGVKLPPNITNEKLISDCKQFNDDLALLEKQLKQEEKEMDIDKKMKVIRRAFELGADINIGFHDFRNKKEAEKIASELSDLTNIPYEEQSYKTSQWFKIRDNNDPSLEFSVFFDAVYMEEDVKLDGMPDGDDKIA